MTAIADSVVVDKTFDVEIADPCKRAILPAETPSPLTSMTLIRDFDTTKTQTFNIKTDVETSNPSILCPLACNLVTPPTYVTKSGNTITADATLTTSANVGTQTISLQCSSIAYSASVVSKTYTFSLDI